jgi:uncharacterized protein YbjQ (UPF0145 family)
MGMCKGCSKVVSVVEMEDGYCKECRDPKIQEEEIIATEKRNSIILTTETAIDIKIDKRIDLISSECIYGINIVKDFFSGIRNVVGGNVQSLETSLKDAKNKVTADLKEQAFHLGGDAVIGVKIEHTYNNAGGGSIMSVFATGTVVKLKV